MSQLFDSMQHIYEKFSVQFEKGDYTNLGQEHAEPTMYPAPYDHHCPDLPYQHPNLYRLSCLVKQQTNWYTCKNCPNRAVITTKEELIEFNKYREVIDDIYAENY